jgi:hypothetical protein
MTTRTSKRTVGVTTAVAVVTFTLTGCMSQQWRPNGSWGYAAEGGFMSGCEGNGNTPNFCSCALGWMETNESEMQAYQESAEYERTGARSANTQAANSACMTSW